MIQPHANCRRCRFREAEDAIALANRQAASRRGWLALPSSPAEPFLLEAMRRLGLFPELQQDVGRFVVDFLFPYERLVVEVDGATHNPLVDKCRDDENLRRFGLDTYRVPAKPLIDGKEDDWAERVYSEVMRARARRDALDWLAITGKSDAA